MWPVPPHRLNMELFFQISEWAKDVSIGVSVFTLTALSAERYCAIVNPMRRHAANARFGAKMFTFMAATLIWALAIAIALPAVVFSRVQVESLGFNRTISVSNMNYNLPSV